MTSRVVLAVGGNALTRAGETGRAEEIVANSAAMAAAVARLHGSGTQVVVVHGNGPQVGNLAIQQEFAAEVVAAQPLHQLCAMTQGQLGSALVREIDRRCGPGSALAVITHLEVDPDDPAFREPTKPIGPFFTEDQADRYAAERGWVMRPDAGRGHRRYVPSPRPTGVVELAAIRDLADAGFIVVAAGGGGIGVRRSGGGFEGVDGVIDKDHAAGLLARELDASGLYLLTSVDALLLDFGTNRERAAHHLDLTGARSLLDSGQLAAGSIQPKVAAAVEFLESGGELAVITSPDRLAGVVAGEPDVGTRITASRRPTEVAG